MNYLITINLLVKMEVKNPGTFLPLICYLLIFHFLHEAQDILFHFATPSKAFIYCVYCFILEYHLQAFYPLLDFTHLHLSLLVLSVCTSVLLSQSS